MHIVNKARADLPVRWSVSCSRGPAALRRSNTLMQASFPEVMIHWALGCQRTLLTTDGWASSILVGG